MLGAIIGDIAGSVYERKNIKTKDFPLFTFENQFTDDSVMTFATAEAIMDGGTIDTFIDAYKSWGREYPDVRYGKTFRRWIASDDRNPYNSFGNGSAMRISPIGWIYETLEETERVAEVSASVTHNHAEGIKGAQVTAAAIFMARTGKTKNEIKAYIESTYKYDLSRSLDLIRPSYSFDISCQGSVPEAIIAFLESTDFEDALRNAISLGGDSDTIAAITGSIAEAFYGIPEWIKKEAFSYLDGDMKTTCLHWKGFQQSGILNTNHSEEG